jgi:hypothetical protein
MVTRGKTPPKKFSCGPQNHRFWWFLKFFARALEAKGPNPQWIRGFFSADYDAGTNGHNSMQNARRKFCFFGRAAIWIMPPGVFQPVQRWV